MRFINSWRHGTVRGAAQSIAIARGSRPRSALRIQTPPLQRRTHRTPGCAPLKRRRHSPARSTCADAPVLRSSPLGADMVGKSRNMSADMLIMPGLLALMPPTICCVRSQSVRDLVTEISAVPRRHRCGVAQSSSSELATQAWPSQPHSRLVVPVHVGSRLAHSGSPTHPSLGRLKAVPFTVHEYLGSTLYLGYASLRLDMGCCLQQVAGNSPTRCEGTGW